MSFDGSSLQAQILRPGDLDAVDIAAWREIQAATPAFASPLLGPDFAQAVGAHRDDARVAIFRRGGETLGFLAYHQRPGGLARPIGAPFSDYHALLSAPGAALSLSQALTAAGLGAYRFNGLIDPHGVTAPQGQREAYAVHLGAHSGDDYLEALRAASPKRFKNMRRLESKLEREVGPLRLVAPDFDQAAFDTIVEWKRDQFKRTGMHDVLGPDWVRGLMQDLFERRSGDFQGLMITLYAGETLIAGHFGIGHGDQYHPWLASTHPDLTAYSPGQTFMSCAIRAMPGIGLTTYDLGPGHDHYKRPFAPEPFHIGEGQVTADNAAGRAATLRDQAWALAASRPIAGRLKRRLDQIASVELTAMGRMRGLAGALSGMAARSASVVHTPLE